VRAAVADRPLHTVVAGLGGRPVTEASLRGLLRHDDLEPLTFLDLNTDLVERELRRRRESPRSGPTAENLLRDLDRVGES
jgi:pyruvate ferredoxin oxidoreductase alpha subunit